MMGDKFDENADNCLSYFLDFCKQRGYVTFSDYPRYHPYDLKVWNETESIVELKMRECTVTDFNDCFLQLDKCTKLQYIAKNEGNQALYVALYPKSDKIAIWKIDKDKQYDWEWRYMWDETSSNSRKKVWKQVILLPISEAKQVDYQFN